MCTINKIQQVQLHMYELDVFIYVAVPLRISIALPRSKRSTSIMGGAHMCCVNL